MYCSHGSDYTAVVTSHGNIGEKLIQQLQQSHHLFWSYKVYFGKMSCLDCKMPMHEEPVYKYVVSLAKCLTVKKCVVLLSLGDKKKKSLKLGGFSRRFLQSLLAGMVREGKLL